MNECSPKVGERVRFTVEGVVTHEGFTWFHINGYAYDAKAGEVEILEQLLAVGDEVTAKNKHLLPERCLILDGRGHKWEHFPEHGYDQKYGPYKLIYIHNNEENNK